MSAASGWGLGPAHGARPTRSRPRSSTKGGSLVWLGDWQAAIPKRPQCSMSDDRPPDMKPAPRLGQDQGAGFGRERRAVDATQRLESSTCGRAR